jgi:hypothetical protein
VGQDGSGLFVMARVGRFPDIMEQDREIKNRGVFELLKNLPVA